MTPFWHVTKIDSVEVEAKHITQAYIEAKKLNKWNTEEIHVIESDAPEKEIKNPKDYIL